MYKIIGFKLSNGEGCKWLDEPINVDTLSDICRVESEQRCNYNCDIDAIYQHLTK